MTLDSYGGAHITIDNQTITSVEHTTREVAEESAEPCTGCGEEHEACQCLPVDWEHTLAAQGAYDDTDE